MGSVRKLPVKFEEDLIDFSKEKLWIHSLEYKRTRRYAWWSFLIACLLIALLIVSATILKSHFLNNNSSNHTNIHSNEFYSDQSRN